MSLGRDERGSHLRHSQLSATEEEGNLENVISVNVQLTIEVFRIIVRALHFDQIFPSD